MKRLPITERPDWREKATEFGFNFHTMYGEPYWCEDAYYQFSLAQIEEIEDATADIHQMCLKVVERVVGDDALMAKFQIPKHVWEFVRSSWRTQQPSLYSRLDLAYDGVNPPKLLENNADTPTSLYEAAFFQWLWLEDQIAAGNLRQDADQYNSLQEKLIERFAELKNQHGFSLLHIACCQDTEEDRGTVQYLQDCALEAELASEFLYIEEIGLGERGQFTDPQDQVISNLFKLYPGSLCSARSSPPSWKMPVYAGWNRRGKPFSRTKPCCRCCGKCSRITRICYRHTSQMMRIRNWIIMWSNRCFPAKAQTLRSSRKVRKLRAWKVRTVQKA